MIQFDQESRGRILKSCGFVEVHSVFCGHLAVERKGNFLIHSRFSASVVAEIDSKSLNLQMKSSDSSWLSKFIGAEQSGLRECWFQNEYLVFMFSRVIYVND